VLFCCITSVAIDSPAHTTRHVPDTGGSVSLSRLDYGNGVLICLPTYLLVRRLQSVLNASARMIFQLRRSDHITDTLASIHWLRVPERIQFKITVQRIKFCMGLHLVTWVRSFMCLICRVGVVSALPAPIAWSCRHSNCLLLAVEHLMLLLLEHGTVCRRM